MQGVSEQTKLEELAPQEEDAQEVPTVIEEPPQAQQGQATGQTVHVVQSGDTLYKLARQYYNDVRMWRAIWQANLDQLPDPNSIEVGQQLIIP